MNQAAVTIQRWYRRHARRQNANQAVLRRFLAAKKKVAACLLWFPSVPLLD